jgi:hypothetical protein
VTYYKWLKPDRTTTYQGVKWPKRVGVWTPDETPVMCVSGWHLATHEGIAEHARTGAVLWIAEGRGESVAAGDKVAFSSARLVSQVGTLTQIIAVQWAAECARRVLKHYEDRYPEDKRPREAIQAALKWAKDPTEANRNAAATAAAYAAYAASAAAYADAAASASADAYADAAASAYAADAAYAAAAAALADAAATAAAYAADAADAAATAAAYAYAYAATYAAYATAAATYAADAAYAAASAYAADADARKKEREWQSDRLLKLLGAS